MKEYLLIASGNKLIWENTSKEEWAKVMEGFGTWIGSLKSDWIRGDSLSSNRKVIVRDSSGARVIDGPFSETKEITGFFLIKANNLAEAAEKAKGCPALLHDTVSVIELEGDRA